MSIFITGDPHGENEIKRLSSNLWEYSVTEIKKIKIITKKSKKQGGKDECKIKDKIKNGM